MNKQIRFILLLIIATTACILAFQLFWIVNSYELNQRQLIKEADQALEKAMQAEMNIRYSSMANYLVDGNTDHISIIKESSSSSSLNIDSLLNVDSKDKKDGDMSISLSFNSNFLNNKDSIHIPDFLNIDLKSIFKRILIEEDNNDNQTNVVVLDSLIKDEFIARELDNNYFFEINNARNDSLLYRSTVDMFDEGDILYTRKIPTSVLKKNFVRLGFPHHNQVIIARMGGILLMSALLIVIVLACFVYMLRTIINQKNLSEIKNDFINNMTHELKTPIATVNAAIEGMQSFDVLADKKKTDIYLSVSSRELKRLSSLVEKVLNIAAYEKKELLLNIESVNLDDMIDNIISNQAIKNMDKIVDIRFKKWKYPVVIEADRMHFNNVINNLIDNAIKYSNESVIIDVRLSKDRGITSLSICDNGIGIANKYQQKVFDKFYRVPTGNLHDVKGFGLGLHYVKSIIEKHQGVLSLKSTIGRGSEFIITLY